jgi:hypothetical protein
MIIFENKIKIFIYFFIKSNKKNNSVGPEKKQNENNKDGEINIPVDVPNSELSYRRINTRLIGPARVYHFYNAPIIKFVNHFVKYLLKYYV